MNPASFLHDFWESSGYVLLDHDSHGRLLVTDEFLKMYLARPEVVPPAEACAVERESYARLISNPRATVTAADIGRMADRDAP